MRFNVEMRAAVDGNTLSGHCVVFGQTAKVNGHYEQIERRAFDEVLKTSDVRFLLNHDPNLLLGRQGSGTLRLETDDRGLKFEVDLPDTQTGRDVRELVKRGDLSGGSFAMMPGVEQWSRAEDGLQIRTHTSVKHLQDASIVTYPQYDETNVELRSLNVRPTQNGISTLIKARATIHGRNI